jgi:hypothetical protein
MRSIILTLLITLAAAACIGSSPFEPWETGPRPAIAQIQPSPAAVGDAITITGSGFTPTNNTLKIGAGYVYKLSSADSTSIRLALPSYLGACPPNQEVCVALALPMAPGDYKLSVINANGTSNQVSFQVITK